MELLSEKDLYDEIADIWMNVLGGSFPAPDDDFFLAGGDSLQLVNLIVHVSARYHRDFDYESFFSEPTMNTLVTMLKQR